MNDSRWITLAFLTLLLFAALTAHASAWYDTDWGYRKSFTVNNTGSELTDYQIMFTVNRSAGSDSGTTVYLDGKCAEDYDDIRFVAADDITLYSYWIENSNSTIASVWVNFTSLPTGDTIAYLYYGNSGASAVSDGDATFPFFDHFDGDALDTDKWTVDSGTPLVSGSVLNLSGSITQKISGKTSFGYNYRFEIRGYHPSNNQAVFGFWSSSEHRTMWLGRAANTNDYVQTRDGPTYTLTDDGIDRSGTTYYIYGGVTRSGASDFYIDRVFRRTLTTHIPTDDMPIALTCEANKGTVCVDWVLVRKYFATEPTVSAWESEEEVPPYWIIADFTGTPTSGNLPLTVYFTSSSTANNCTIDTWQWSFGDSTSNSTSQNPAHTYTTTGLYDVILTITNTSFSLTNSTIKADYINVTSGGATPTPTTPTPTPTVTGTATVPTQEPAQPGRISPMAFVVLMFMVCGLTLYTFADNANRNYLYIATAAIAMILAFLCGTFLITGYITEDFVVTDVEASINESVLSTYAVHQAQIIDIGTGYFFTFWGVVMLIITILAVIELLREPQRRYEE